MRAIYIARIRVYINIRKGVYVHCTLHGNHFATCCNLSPNTRIIAAMHRVLSKLFPRVNVRGRTKMCNRMSLDH